MRKPSTWLVLVLACTLAWACTRTPKTTKTVTLRSRLLSLADAAGGLDLKSAPAGLAWSPDGSMITYLEPGPDGVNRLMGFSVKDARVTELVHPSKLLGELVESEAERAMRERMRMAAGGITRAFWLPDSRRILLPVSGHLFLHDVVSATSRRLDWKRPTSCAEGLPLLAVKLSPDGRLASFTCAQDVYLLDLEKLVVVRVTDQGSPTRFFGLAEFVAQEEMKRFDGLWWSPDSRRLLLADVDESAVPVRERPDLGDKSASIVAQRYPAAGTVNAQVKLLLHDRETGKSIPVQLPEYEYLARVHWLGPERFLVAVQDRGQHDLQLLSCGLDGACSLFLREVDEDWVELHTDLKNLSAKDGTFFWSTENPECYDPGKPASGLKTLFVFSKTSERRKSSCKTAEGPLELPVPVARLELPPDMTLDALLAVDSAGTRAVVTAFGEKGRERHLYEWNLQTRAVRRIGAEQSNWISAWVSPDFSHFAATIGYNFRPDETAVFTMDSRTLHVFVKNPPVPGWQLAREVDVPVGDTTMNGLLWEPPVREPGKKAPAIIFVYGGPHGHMVKRQLNRYQLWCRAMADQGFHVLMVDGRGGMYRDRAFAKVPRLALGQFDVEDARAAIHFLQKTEGVDPARIGLWGWSYGGYLAIAALFRIPELAAAVAVAPPVDWELYDTHYTERYLGLPSQQKEAYQKASLLADPVPEKPLLLIHGMSDDNVLMINTLQLSRRMQDLTIPFDMMLYPGKAHSLWGTPTRTHLLRTITRFFQRNL